MVGNVFVYGSLQFPAVMHAVTGRRFPSGPARLEGYLRRRLRCRCYPGLRRRDGACTDGVLYRRVNPRALACLDRFEDSFYRRRTLQVVVEPGKRLMAEVYVIPPQHYRMLEPRGWSPLEFRRHALKCYLRQCRRRPPGKAVRNIQMSGEVQAVDR